MLTNKSRPIIATDIDEVLADLLDSFLNYYNNIFETEFRKTDFKSYQWWDEMGVSKEELMPTVDEFMTSLSAMSMREIPGAYEGVIRLHKKNDIAAVTARQEKIELQTKVWLNFSFTGVFDSIYHSPKVEGKFTSKKSDIVKDIGAILMIEDQYDNAVECADAGISVLLFDQPWNQRDSLPKRITRVYSWSEIVNRIENKLY